MKLQLLICLIFIAFIVSNANKARNKAKARARTKSKAKSKKFLTSTILQNLAQKGDKPASVIPTTTGVKDGQSMVIVEHSDSSNHLASHEDVEYESPCKVKQGYMAMVTDSQELKSGGAAVLRAKSVFVVLNDKTLAVFENENVDSLVNTYDIHDLADPLVPELWSQEKLNCFELHQAAKGAVSGNFEGGTVVNNDLFVDQPTVSFCLDTQQQMAKWVNAIKTFHKCYVKKKLTNEVEESSVSIGVRKVRAEFQEEEKEEESFQQVKQEKQEELERAEAEQDAREKDEIEKELAKIRHTYQLEKNKEKALERSNQERQEQLEEQTELLEQKQKCIREALQNKASSEVEATNQMIKQESNLAELKKLEKVNTDVEGIGEKELSEEQERAHDLNEEQKEQQDKIKNLMVEQTMEFEKDLDPAVCVSDQLKTNKAAAMKEACGRTVEPGHAVQIKELQECLQVDHFCKYCCKYYIGMAHETKQASCIKQCSALVDTPGADIEMTDDAYVIRVPTSSATGVGSADNSAPTTQKKRLRRFRRR